jgi:Leucine-rich repeat (LRR) protein
MYIPKVHTKIEMTKIDSKNQKYMDSKIDRKTKFLIISNYLDETLDLSNFSYLRGVKCGDFAHKTRIKKIIFPEKCQFLTNIICNDIGLEEIVLPRFSPRLDILVVRSNLLKELELFDCSQLEILDCSNNRLLRLLLPGECQNLKTLIVSNNLLSCLDLPPYCPALKYIYCNHNNLVGGYNLRGYENLSEFYFSTNGSEMRIMDISTATMKSIECSHIESIIPISREIIEFGIRVNGKILEPHHFFTDIEEEESYKRGFIKSNDMCEF